MPIAPGHTLLHYRIVDKLGEGGMGGEAEALQRKDLPKPYGLPGQSTRGAPAAPAH